MSNASEFKRVKKFLDGASNTYRGQIEQILELNAQEAAAYARQLAPVDMGELQKSIRVEADPNRNRAYVISRSVVADAEYAPYVEFGTKSRAVVPSEWSSYAKEFKGGSKRSGAYERIMLWASNQGFDKERARAIFFSIMKFGNRPHPFMYPAFRKYKNQIRKDIRKLFK